MTLTTEENITDDGSLPPALFQHWIHSREEDTGDIEIYRPEGFAFPPSFGRDGFEMQRDGVFILDVIGAADGVEKVPGRWISLGGQKIKATFDEPERDDFSFEVVAVDDYVLQLKRLEQQEKPEEYRSLPEMDEAQMEAFRASPVPSSFRLLDFDKAQILTKKTFPPSFVLRVSGTKPFVNMTVELVPVVFIRHPEYWIIEVVGSLQGIGLPALAPYDVAIPLDGITGSIGVEVVGATRRERFDLFPGGPSES